jgi:hypothetical protein
MDKRDQSSRYRVVVRGGMGASFAAGFEGFELEARDGETALSGALVDQAQLYGLLERLRDLGISIVSVNPLD